jgi:hypothetical protein
MPMSSIRYVWLLGIALLSIVIWGVIFRQPSRATNIPDTPESRAVTAALENAFRVLDIPAEQLDLAELATVLVNDPRYQAELHADELRSLLAYTGEIQGDAATKEFGFLTAMRTKRINQQHGAKLLRAALEQAKLEDRALTPEEWQTLTDQNYGMQPYLAPELPAEQSTPFVRPLSYLDVRVDGEQAEILFDTGVKRQRAILVRIDGQWFVAGIF